MKFNTENHLKIIIDKLQGQGVEIGYLAHIEQELISTHQPWYSKIGQTVKSNWSHVIGEISESKRMIQLLTNGVEALSPTEKEEVKEQLSDLFRIIPAGLIATANAVLPLPGTSAFTPLLLHKAGLLPSRWREAHMLNTLQKEQTRLKQLG